MYVDFDSASVSLYFDNYLLVIYYITYPNCIFLLPWDFFSLVMLTLLFETMGASLRVNQPKVGSDFAGITCMEVSLQSWIELLIGIMLLCQPHIYITQ